MTPRRRAFADMLRPARLDGGFRQEGYFVWCGSPIRDDDGCYHLFASRWPSSLAFHPHWLTNSEIVRATSPTPEGPYAFAEVVLPPRGPQWWDGRMTHNPMVCQSGDTYVMFYTGTSYDGPAPTPTSPVGDDSPQVVQAHAAQRIGLATAARPQGPWTRFDAPILEPRPGHWDGLITTNPAPCVLSDGRVLLVYKSTRRRGNLLRLGVAMAERFDSPFTRLSDEPILRFDETGDHVEDPYLWLAEDGSFEMVMKDMRGGLGGEPRGGVHARSDDGVHWQLCDPTQAYSRTVPWSDGHTSTQDFLERPHLLIEDGRPTHVFAATSVGGETAAEQKESWIMVMPMADES